MAKTATQGTHSPGLFGPGAPILETSVQATAEALNYAVGENVARLFGVVCSDDTWGSSGNEIATHNVKVRTDTTEVDVYQAYVWIDADCQEIGFYSVVKIPTAANTVLVTMTLGSSSVINTHTNATSNAEVSGSVLTSATGTGKRLVKVTIKHTVGAAADCRLVSCVAEGKQIAAADLPSPGDE